MTAPRPRPPVQQRSPYERRRLVATVAATAVTAWWLHSVLGDDQAAPVIVPAAATVYVQQFAGPSDIGPTLEPSTFSSTERLLPSGRVARGGGGTFEAVGR